MDVFTKLFGDFLVFVYHCFDRIVIHGYLTALSRPELVVHFFRDIVGVAESGRPTISAGWKPMRATIRSRSSGPRKGCARRTTCCRGSIGSRDATPTASTSSSRAWSKGRPTASACRNRAAALKFLKRVMKKYGRPLSVVTDGLCSYPAAMKEIGNADRQEAGRRLNNRAENSHQPFRRRERAMQRFRSMKTLQKFSSVHAQVHNHFNQERHLVTRQVYKQRRSAALAEWSAFAA